MNIYGMAHFQSVCKNHMVEWYNNSKFIHNGPNDIAPIGTNNVYVVWACKTLQNYKALVSTDVKGDGVYAEYTYNGDTKELYEDVYVKSSNRCIK